MRPVLFVVCFSLGLTLMIWSGYLPQSASARSNGVQQRRVDDRAADLAKADRRERDAGRSGPRRPADAQRNKPRGSAAEAQRARESNAEATPARMSASSTSQYDQNDDWPADAAESDAHAQADDEYAYAEQWNDEYDDSAAALDEGAIDAPELPADLPGSSAKSAVAALRDLGSALNGEARETGSGTDAEMKDAGRIAADAGADQVVWTGWDELKLSGSGSGGDELTYRWRQLRGPAALVIAEPEKAKTTAHGLPLGVDMTWDPTLYEFELQVSDEQGQQATDMVSYVVLSAPDITIKPTPERYFEFRDGYPLAHFEVWVTNLETYESTFEISSPVALSFTQVGGDEYELRRSVRGRTHRYRITLYQADEVGRSWTELLVNSTEKVPAMIQLGVSWYGS